MELPDNEQIKSIEKYIQSIDEHIASIDQYIFHFLNQLKIDTLKIKKIIRQFELSYNLKENNFQLNNDYPDSA